MYYVMESDNENTGAMLMRRPNLPLLDVIAFDDGVLIQEEVPVIDLHMDSETQGELLDYVWVTLGGIVISDRFRRIFESLGIENIQYFPIRIINDVTGHIHTNYFIANIIGRIACLDLETSQVTYMRGLPHNIASIEEMHLINEKIQEQAIFRLDEWVILVLCNAAVRDAAVNAGIRGCVFTPAEDYSM